MRRAGIVLSFVLLALSADPAFADGDWKQIGPALFSAGQADSHAEVVAFMVTDSPQKMVGIGIKDPDDPDKTLGMVFDDGKEWAKFVAFWSKARRAKPPTEAEQYDLKSGPKNSYFDLPDDILVSADKTGDGSIEFTWAGKPDPVDKHPTALHLFELVAGDIKAFDANVRAASKYLAK